MPSRDLRAASADGAGQGGPGASEAQIQAAAQALGVELPAFYADFLRRSNGLDPVGRVLLYSTDDLAERNETFGVRTYAPGYLAIGDDSGGRAILIALDGPPAVFVVDHGSMDPDDFAEAGPDLVGWLDEGAALP